MKKVPLHYRVDSYRCVKNPFIAVQNVDRLKQEARVTVETPKRNGSRNDLLLFLPVSYRKNTLNSPRAVFHVSQVETGTFEARFCFKLQ
jgi:hypothetical protein